MSAPDISILIASYNRAHTIRECIDSILMQTYPSKEIIVVDDGSADNTREVLEAYGGRIHAHFLGHQGLSGARNAAIALSHGLWIAFLDSDDYYLSSDVLEDYRDCFRKDPALDVVASGWRVVDSAGRPLSEVAPWNNAPELDLESFLNWKPAFPSAKMFRREVLEKAGGFDPAFESAMDTDLFFRILLKGARIGWLRKITCGLRQSADSMMGNAPRQARFLLRALDRVFSSPELPQGLKPKESAIRYATHLWLAWHLWSRGFPGEASAAFPDARRYRRERPFYQLGHWRRIFDEHSDRAGFQRIPQPDFLSLAVPAFALSDQGRIQIALIMDWWWNVWSGYAEGRIDEPPAPAALKIPDGPVLVELTKRCIHLGNDPAPVNSVDRFWSDALRKGWIRPEAQEAVITLYLACFTRSVFTRRVRPAVRGLAKALWASRSRKALGPWLRFFQAAIRHYLFGSQPEDEEKA